MRVCEMISAIRYEIFIRSIVVDIFRPRCAERWVTVRASELTCSIKGYFKCFEVYVEIVEVENVTTFPADSPVHLHIDHSFWEQLKIDDLGMKGWDLMFGWNKEKWKSFL